MSANAASFSSLRLPARNPFSPHRPRPAPASFPTHTLVALSRPPKSPPQHSLSPKPPPPHDPPGLATGCAGLGIRPPQAPATAAGVDTSSPGTVRVPHLPVTPQQPRASHRHRHRLPQQPANCSTTTGPLIEWAGTLNNSRSHWPRRRLGPPSGAPPKRVRPGTRKTRFSYPSPQRPRAQSDAGCRVWQTVSMSSFSYAVVFLPRLGALRRGRNAYRLLRFPAVRNARRQRPFPVGSVWKVE